MQYGMQQVGLMDLELMTLEEMEIMYLYLTVHLLM